MAGLFDFSGLAQILSAGGDAAVKLRTAITGDNPADALAKLQQELNATQASDAGQNAVNLEEAKSENLFKSGWRPSVGWVCSVGLAWDVIGHPVATWACAIWAPSVVVPSIDTSVIVPMLGGLLGLGTLRTVEKIRGKS